MKKLLFNLKISKIFYLVIFICNVVFPLKGKVLNISFFNLVIIILWTYALLSHLGYFLKQVSENEDGVIEYENSIPMVKLAVVRIAEAGYYALFRRDIINWRIYVILVGIDIIYVVFLLFDKGNYYYESEEMK